MSYSQRTANRLMQLFEEYGDKLFASTDDGGSSNSSALTNLTYYQALLLLGIPEDEREKFILQRTPPMKGGKIANPFVRESALACFTTGYAFPDRNEITAGTPLIVFRLFPYTNIYGIACGHHALRFGRAGEPSSSSAA